MPKSTKRVMWGALGEFGTPIYDKNDLSPDWQPMSKEEIERRRMAKISRRIRSDPEFAKQYEADMAYMAEFAKKDLVQLS